ncbi:MAG: hypothetical protein J6D29_04785 [Solobacterium sp.]|nr:hypothetical protein [Solobacterium sp.]
MSRIKGITVILINHVEVGRDRIDNPIYEEERIVVKNVLVTPSASDASIDSVSLYGDRAIYTLAIPKGDKHNWENQEVEFFGKKWRTFGIPFMGIEENIPLDWNMKVMVERYE